jgi:hypothetical protein
VVLHGLLNEEFIGNTLKFSKQAVEMQRLGSRHITFISTKRDPSCWAEQVKCTETSSRHNSWKGLHCEKKGDVILGRKRTYAPEGKGAIEMRKSKQ